MIKRIRYVSRFESPLSEADIQAIGEQSRRNNERLGLTGVLMASGGLFYQVLEGPDEAVDEVYRKIVEDGRHTDLLLLSTETGVNRLFPSWSMKTINLDASSHVRLFPLKALIMAVFEQTRLAEQMMWAIERTVQHEMRRSD
ncbi:MAG TPA: BLUF domain-containing protein [Chondromyces sp.]|nr:BLUF domain-containing protein [Chondromyces sp.]